MKTKIETERKIDKIEYYYREHREFISWKELLSKFVFKDIKNIDFDNLCKVVLQNDYSLLFEYINDGNGKYYNEIYIRNKNGEYEIS